MMDRASFDYRRLAAGLMISASGIIMTHSGEFVPWQGPAYVATYLLGVLLGLAGLAVIALSMKLGITPRWCNVRTASP